MATATVSLTWAIGAGPDSAQHFGYTRGEHLEVAFAAADAAAGDITGWALAVLCVTQPGRTPVYTRTTAPGDGVVITDGPNRVFKVTLPFSITASSSVPAGVYVLEVWRTDAGLEDLLAYVYVTVAESSFPVTGPPLPTPGALPLPVTLGGTGVTSHTAGTLLGGNGVAAVTPVTVGSGLALAGGVLTATVQLDTANTWTGDQTHVGALIAHELRNADDSAFVTLAEDELRLFSAGVLTITATTGLVVVNSGLSAGTLIVDDVATVTSALQTPTLRDLDLTVEINLGGGVVAVAGDLTVSGAFVLPHRTEPADETIAAGQLVLWYDGTPATAKLMIKAKDTGGTVVTGEVALS